MAKFSSSGLDDLFRDMYKMGEATGEVADAILMAGAEEVRKAWRTVANELNYKDTGKLIDSVGYARAPKTVGDVKSIEIYPKGIHHTNKNGTKVRNAEVAFILHYGTSKRPGSHWVDKASALAVPELERVASEIWDEELRKRGL